VGGYTDPGGHVFWLASRSLGVVALVLLAASVTIGLFLSGRISRRPGAAARLKHLHEALALTATGAIAGHGLFLLGDRYLHPSLSDIAVPFAMVHQPVWTGIGIIGGWMAAIITFSFYVRKWIGNRAWRWLHRWTLAVYLLSVAHTIGSGTDTRSAWVIALLVAITTPIVFGATYRFLPAAPEPRKRRATVNQQMRGNGSPASMSTTRLPPNAVSSSTSPGGSGWTSPTSAAPEPSG
jgi:methionine sulfoxide reductase heme-binding subunit